MAALQFFVRVVESGSFSQAARELGVGQPAVSKQVAALERRLGAQLLNRTPRAMRPTPAGADFYDAAVRILGDLEDAETRVASGHATPAGAVRVAAPPILTSLTIVPQLPHLFARFPGMSVEFVVSERYADLVREGLDLAIRVGHLEDSGLVARRIGSMTLATVASPAYLARYGVPLNPSDLTGRELLPSRSLGAADDWRFSNSDRDLVTPTGPFSCNNPADMRAAVLAGLGIVQSARALFELDLHSGDLIEILAEFVPDPIPIHVLYNSTRVPRRVRILSEFIKQCVDDHPSLRLQQGHSTTE